MNFSAAAVQAEDYTYTTNGGNITITKYTGSGGAVSIPSTIDGLPVTSIGEWAIWQGAFWSCTNVTSVTIPDSVTRIGDRAFASCHKLTNITIPDSVNIIGREPFFECTHLTAIRVGEANFAYRAVDGVLFNNNLTALIQYPEGKAGSYTIPNSVTCIGAYAFSHCTRLTSVTIPDSVTSIGEAAFARCTRLTSVTVPNSVISIGIGAFAFCTNLTGVTIPNSVENIGKGAFGYCTSLTSVTIPNSVTSIGDGAFGNCSSLSGVTIPNSVTNIDFWTFAHCSSLTSITIPTSVTSIGREAFAYCTSLTSVTIPNSVTNIENWAFRHCIRLSSGTIPKSVTNIGGFVMLPPRDVAEIRSRVRREIWRGVLPRFDWSSIRNLPPAVRSRAAARIAGIDSQPNGTVEVMTVDRTFYLRKGQDGWQIVFTMWSNE